MADGKPIQAFAFTQSEEGPVVEVPDVEVVEAPATENTPERSELKLHNRLLEHGEWSEEPRLDDQESRFPDSVRTHAVTYRLFNVNLPTDMQEYSKIFMSNAKRGRFVFDGPEDVKWDLPNARCFILVRVEERRFLALTTSDSNPNSD